MTCAAGRPGWRITSHSAARTGRGSGGTARAAGPSPATAGRAAGATGRDSGSHFQAKPTLTTHSAAATRPGAVSPQRALNEPSAGPTITPKLVAADSQPSALARSCGSIVSATYACATPVAPPPGPWTNRDRNSSGREPANPKIRYAAAEAARPTSSAGRRP